MKKLVIALLALLTVTWSQGQQVDVRVNPNVKVKQDIKVKPKVKVDVNLKEVMAQAMKNIDLDLDIDLDRDIDLDIDNDLDIDLDRDFDFDFDFDHDIDIDTDLGDDDDDDDDDDNDNDRGRSNYQQESQEVDIPLSKPGERGTLRVESNNGRITIKAYDGPSVKLKMTKYGRRVNSRSSSSGMRRIGGSSFNVEATEYQNNVKIENEGWGNRVDFEIQVPKSFDIKAESYNNGHIVIEGVEGQLDIESYNGPITLKDINGAASASTYNGAVRVSFTGVTADTPMAFSTYNGDVDLTLPGSAKITAKMKTNRDIYTDFEQFSLSDQKPVRSEGKSGAYKIKFENWTVGAVNGGGPEVMMKTTNGNIYIRKN